ncbi:MAG: hypothetical protein WBO35_01665 [Candidatus Saccharimonadales bacterium]
MKQILSFLVLSIGLVLGYVTPVTAAPARTQKSVAPLGIDISYPQCKGTLPTSQAFTVVGVNGGKASTANPCLAKQLLAAARATGSGLQPKVQLYVNTGSPGDYIDLVASWPNDNTYKGAVSTPPSTYGECKTDDKGVGQNSVACAWQYGWERAYDDVNLHLGPAINEANAKGAKLSTDPASYVWWLDVETMNSWQEDVATDPDAYRKNVAALEGMIAQFKSYGNTKVGLYSTNYQWNKIVGNAVLETSPLYGLDTWYALDQTTVSVARKACYDRTIAEPLTGVGAITLTQFISGNQDYDVACADVDPPLPTV